MVAQPNDEFIGIEIGGTKLQLVVGDERGKIIDSVRYKVIPSYGAKGIQKQVKEALGKLMSKHSIKAVGTGFGGPINWHEGRILVSHQIDGWSNFPLKEWIEDLSGKPAAIDNDANTAALAEALAGYGKGHDRVFYMTIGSGIGGGLIVDQQVYHGRIPGEVEIGHIRLNKTNRTLESSCSGWAVNEKIRAYIQQNPNCLFAELAKDLSGPEAMLLKPALEKEDAEANRMFAELTDDIAFALSHVVHLFHPNVLIIGGGLSLIGERLRVAIAEKISAYIMKAFLPPPPVRLALLKQDVVPIGALFLAAKAVVKN